MALSPMMQQYQEIKDKHKDCILFFRLGDFYEMFFDDAIIASKELEVTLTGKNCGLKERAPMCGVPFHSADSYISRLIERGYKVAICEQVEDPAQTKGIVKREVVQILTPGTITSGSMLREKENNYLVAIYATKGAIGFSYCDVSTGEVYVTNFEGSSLAEILANEIVRIMPKEIIINESATDFLDINQLESLTSAYFTKLASGYYNISSTTKTLLKQWNMKSLAGIGIEEKSPMIQALGSQLLYLLETQKQNLGHLMLPIIYTIGSYMALDKATIKNLEITETLVDKSLKGSLLGILDKTHTAMGSRKMKKWLREPLNAREEIVERLDGVEELIVNYMTRNNLKESLKGVYDFERLAAKISCGTANGKDLLALRNSLYSLPDIKMDLSDSKSKLLSELSLAINPLPQVLRKIEEAINEDVGFILKDGGVIKDGYSEELDKLKNSIAYAKTWIAELEDKEKKRTGIPNIKVGFNRVFGYYIEITKSNYNKIPENYIRKQTLANAERFITPELKDMENKVLNAETKINQMEYELFVKLRDYIKSFIEPIQETSSCISTLDVLVSFAEISDRFAYTRPIINDGDEIILEKGRHPVIEQTIQDGIFVSNDTYINRKDASMLLITGPNMAGKSTYMRQTALIVLMAQAGCFVPCQKATIGVVDRIFTRIGASDNLASGQSTFFVEMSELAYILNNASNKSLIILDEIGRGTSTYDGLSIAFAVSEYLCKEVGNIRTLFASHYHELTSLEGILPGFKNLNVDVSEENGNIVFLHKIIEGSASRSYGIHVAKLAGVPKSVLESATNKLAELEKANQNQLSLEEQQLQFNW